jgi:hypothetical protein
VGPAVLHLAMVALVLEIQQAVQVTIRSVFFTDKSI